MRRIPTASDYSQEYEQLLHAASAPNAAPVILRFDSASKAKAVRLKLYAYFRALRTEALRPDLAHLTTLLTVSMLPEPGTLQVSLSSGDWDNEAIRAALNLPRSAPLPPAPAPEAPNDLRERLAALRSAPHS